MPLERARIAPGWERRQLAALRLRPPANLRERAKAVLLALAAFRPALISTISCATSRDSAAALYSRPPSSSAFADLTPYGNDKR